MFYGYVLLGLLLASVSVSAGKDRYNDGVYKTINITECKNEEIEDVYNQGRVRVLKAGMWDSCSSTNVMLEAKYKSSRLLVRVTDIDCSGLGSLEIKGTSKPVTWFCESTEDLPTVWSTRDYLKITFNSGFDNLNSDKTIKLDLYYNELLAGPCSGHYRDDDDTTDDTDDDDDDDDEFQCSTRQDGRAMCIDDILKCDGFNNCGDGSDEHSSVCGLPTTTIGSSGTNASTEVPRGIIAIAVICALLGLLLIICIVGLCVLSKNKKNNSRVKKSSKNAIGPNVIASVPKQDPAIYHIKAEGDFPTLSPPPYLVGGSRYANAAVAPGALDAERGASAPIYEDLKVSVNGEVPTQTSTNQ